MSIREYSRRRIPIPHQKVYAVSTPTSFWAETDLLLRYLYGILCAIIAACFMRLQLAFAHSVSLRGPLISIPHAIPSPHPYPSSHPIPYPPFHPIPFHSKPPISPFHDTNPKLSPSTTSKPYPSPHSYSRSSLPNTPFFRDS